MNKPPDPDRLNEVYSSILALAASLPVDDPIRKAVEAIIGNETQHRGQQGGSVDAVRATLGETGIDVQKVVGGASSETPEVLKRVECALFALELARTFNKTPAIPRA